MTLPSLPPLVWLIGSGAFFAIGEFLSKKYVMSPHLSLLLLLVSMYVIGALLWLPALMQQKDLSLTGTLWSVISLCMTVAIGVLLFHESLNTLRIVGMAFAIISIVILTMA